MCKPKIMYLISLWEIPIDKATIINTRKRATAHVQRLFNSID